MRRRSSECVLLLAFACVGAAAQVQPTHPAPIKTAPIERAAREPLDAWPQAGFDITITDRDGHAATGITLSQLVLSDNGKLPADATLTPSTSPQSVCLVVDTSGSTYEDRPIIRAEIFELIRGLPVGDELCGVAFDAEPHLDVPLTMGRKPLTDWVSFLRSSGGSALRDAVGVAALELEQNARFRSRAIILISDGGENASNAPELEFIAAMHARGAPAVYTLENSGAGAHDHAAAKRLFELTTESGGLEFPVRGDRDVQPAVDRLLRAMSSRYRLVVTPADAAADGKVHHLSVQLNKELRKEKMSLAAAETYDAP